MDITTIAIVFVILCLLALYGGIFWAIRYDERNPNWYEPKTEEEEGMGTKGEWRM